MLRRIGKVTQNWIDDKAEWKRKHPPDYKGFWYCYLNISPRCLYRMDEQQLQLDHVVARTRDPSKRREQKNFKPVCAPCNEMKGSKSVEEVT